MESSHGVHIASPPSIAALRYAGPAPQVSVIVAWTKDEPHLARQLERCGEALRVRDVDVVVVTRGPISDQTVARNKRVRFVAAPRDATTARLRELGALQATGDVVMLVDGGRDGRSLESLCAEWMTPVPRAT